MTNEEAGKIIEVVKKRKQIANAVIKIIKILKAVQHDY